MEDDNSVNARNHRPALPTLFLDRRNPGKRKETVGRRRCSELSDSECNDDVCDTRGRAEFSRFDTKFRDQLIRCAQESFQAAAQHCERRHDCISCTSAATDLIIARCGLARS